MIPEAREVRVSRKDRQELERRCSSPRTIQRDLKRARIVLLAAAGRSTRSIAKEVGVQPRNVSLWRHRFADQGLEGLKDRPRPGKERLYTPATDKRILGLLDKPAPKGFARWSGPLLAKALGDVDVQYVWRCLRHYKIDLAARNLRADILGLPPRFVLIVDESLTRRGMLKYSAGRSSVSPLDLLASIDAFRRNSTPAPASSPKRRIWQSAAA